MDRKGGKVTRTDVRFTPESGHVRCTSGCLLRAKSRRSPSIWNASRLIARSGRHLYLGMTIVRLTPATAFKETVRGGDLTQDNTAGQIAAWINYAAPELA